MIAFFHSFSSYPFDTDNTFLSSARANFTQFSISQEMDALSLRILDDKLRDLQLFYYIRVIAKLPIETYQRAVNAFDAMQQACPYANTLEHDNNHHLNGMCTFGRELKDVEWMAWNDYDSLKPVLIINGSLDIHRLSKYPKHPNHDKNQLIVLTENANSMKQSVADLLALRMGDVFVPAERCVRICNVMWYIDTNIVKEVNKTSLVEQLVTRLFEAEARYAGPSLS